MSESFISLVVLCCSGAALLLLAFHYRRRLDEEARLFEVERKLQQGVWRLEELAEDCEVVPGYLQAWISAGTELVALLQRRPYEERVLEQLVSFTPEEHVDRLIDLPEDAGVEVYLLARLIVSNGPMLSRTLPLFRRILSSFAGKLSPAAARYEGELAHA